MDILLPYGEKQLKIPIPPHWELIKITEQNEKEGISNNEISKTIRKAFLNPIGCPSLKDLINSDYNIVIVVDDITRPTPSKELLTEVINYLNDEIGLPNSNIKIIFGLGVHREMIEEEVERKLGSQIKQSISWENHNCYANLVELGQSSQKTPIKLNKTFTEADFKIAIGLIEPHLWAGYSGGYKAVVPGLSGMETIVKNHALAMKKGVDVGLIEKNPFRNDINEIGAKMNLDFIINCILNHRGEICKILAGHPLQAFNHGVEVARDLFEIPITEIADVIITSANPLGIDFRQSGKALMNTKIALRKGGVTIVASPCPEGIGNLKLSEKAPNRKLIELLARYLPSKLLMKIIQKQGYGIEDAAATFSMFKFLAHKKYVFLSDGLSEKEKKILFVADHVSTPQEAINHTERLLKNEIKKEPIKVIVFPLGGCTYPKLIG